jgi:hypothetical protein
VGPLTSAVSNEDPLLAQLLKAKGKMDTFAINCLTELLSLMAKDEDIARFIYRSAPPTYQMARYTDWIRPYLLYQRSEAERTSSYTYYKTKYENILKSIKYLDTFEDNFVAKFHQEELEALEKAEQTEVFTQDVQKDWMAYKHSEVTPHFPPQLIIGKQTQDDKEFMVYDEDPLVKVTLSEVTCEYNYSNPTEYFNLSIPHIEFKTNMYTTISYAQFKKNAFELEKKQRIEELKAQNAAATPNTSAESTAEATNDAVNDNEDPQSSSATQQQVVDATLEAKIKAIESESLPPLHVRHWFETKREGAILLKVSVTSKHKKKIKVAVGFSVEPEDLPSLNVNLPKSLFKDKFVDSDTKCYLHLQKLDLTRADWGTFKIIVAAKEVEGGVPQAPPLPTAGSYPFALRQVGYATMGLGIPMNYVMLPAAAVAPQDNVSVLCRECGASNDVGMDFCDRCGEALVMFEENIQNDYYTNS